MRSVEPVSVLVNLLTWLWTLGKCRQSTLWLRNLQTSPVFSEKLTDSRLRLINDQNNLRFDSHSCRPARLDVARHSEWPALST